MRATFKGILLALAGVVLAVVATEASACSYACVATGGSPFCRRCVNTGEWTAATCYNSGQCGCFYTPNICDVPPYFTGADAADRSASADASEACPATSDDGAEASAAVAVAS